ncbi:MAG: pantoate--beta-alanine ligase [Methylophaga sp.]|nr:MAG: pantoate--beta-alanine ligase [Methylophaga sp.]
MQIVDSITAIKAKIKEWRQQQQSIAFVPTMGNLHQGHLSLVEKAHKLADKVVVSIFVNPLQFDEQADLSAYPRTMDADIEQLSSVNCDLLFMPTVQMMYPQGTGRYSTVVVPGMDDKLCGQSRPGHFDGVATVVSKFFNIVQADIAIFGEKDYQQLLLIKKLVLDLNISIEVHGSPTYREQSGLAMSSRNQYLTDIERDNAAVLYQILLDVKKQLEQGQYDFATLQQQAMEKLKLAGFKPEYVEIRRAEDLELATKKDNKLRVLAAAYLGEARLIDNIACYLA